MKEFSYDEVIKLVDDRIKKCDNISYEDFKNMVGNDIKIMSYMNKCSVPLLKINEIINFGDHTIIFNPYNSSIDFMVIGENISYTITEDYKVYADNHQYDITFTNNANEIEYLYNFWINKYMVYHNILHSYIGLILDNKKEEKIKWYSGDEFPELDGDNSIHILVEFENYSDTMARNVIGDFYYPERLDGPYACLKCDDKVVEFENKKDFASRVKRWRYMG